ncbi:hypothetical protein ABLE91_08280 [Aquabacter sp. CN5-332]|uniref:hypothetical protein n=1 Tax=Aquabacter sp. CN5-332 TaxID=3156608 RepID=UPI0032B3D9CB
MNARLLFSLLLAAVLIGGVMLKVLAAPRVDVDATPLMTSAMRAFLEQQGLSVLGVHQNLDLTLVDAEKRPSCRITLANMAPQGWHGGVVRRMADDGAQLFFVFDGAIFPEQPAMRARLQLYLSLILRHLGFSAPVHPLLGVIADKDCHAATYPWANLTRIAVAAEGAQR